MADPFKLESFVDLYDAVREAIGIQAADTNATNKIKRIINMYYLNEVVPFKRWTWLSKTISVVHGAYYNVDTIQVAPASTTITFNTPPNIALGSFATYRFAIDNSNKVYTIQSHTAGAATAVLTSAYQENVSSASKYKIWRDRVDLPTNAKETVQISHAEQTQPLTALGSQAFRKYETSSPKREGFPSWYNTDTFFDPSGTEGESDRYRQTRLFPAITATPVTLNIDYIEEATPLVEDDDEPILPLEDRIVLYYGSVSRAWSLLQRNEEMGDKWELKANAKLARMAGERDDGFDTPKITPDGTYVNSQRNGGLKRRRYGVPSGGQSSVQIPSYLKNVIIEGGTLTADLAVSAGVLIGGIDMQALGLSENLTQVNLLDATSNQVAATFSLALYNTAHIEYSITRGTTLIEAGKITLSGTNSSASIAVGGVSAVGDVGVEFDTDISGGNIRLLATTSSTGTAPVLSYKVRPWLG